jgi:cell division protein FtsW
LLVIAVTCLIVIGVAATFSVSSFTRVNGIEVTAGFVGHQVIAALMGAVLAVFVATIHYRLYERVATVLLVASAVLMVATVLPGLESIAPRINGARRWIVLPGMRLQPSELARMAVLIWMAAWFAADPTRVRRGRGLLPVVAVGLGLVALLAFQPNLSMAVMVCAGMAILAWAAGLSRWWAVAGVGTGLLGLGGLALSASYRLARVETFLGGGDAQEGAFQVRQALIGFGSGGPLGVGFSEGTQKLGYLPYAYSDFLFAAIGEEFGFVGVSLILLAFLAVGFVGFRIAQGTPDRFGRLLAVGMTVFLLLGAMVHIGVNLAVLPTTGIPLPFMSVGRTSLWMSMAAVGVLHNIATHAMRPLPPRRGHRIRRLSAEWGLRDAPPSGVTGRAP